jgi:hypothetical protein
MAQPSAEIPQMIIDDDLNKAAAKGMATIDALIHEDPATAQDVIDLYSADTDAGDKWLKILSDPSNANRVPFRLTAALGKSATRHTMRFISYDAQTEDKISDNKVIKDLIKQMRSNAQTDDEALSRRVGLKGLLVYAGAVAAVAAVKAPPELPAANEEADLRTAG